MRPSLFPEAAGPGYATRRALLRSLACYAVIFAAGSALSFGGYAPWQKSLGLGLMAPGGGFLLWAAGDYQHAALHAGMALASLLAFAVSLALWFATGNVIAPAGVWFVSAIAAAAMNHQVQWHAAPRALVAGLVSIMLGSLAFYLACWLRGTRIRRRSNALLVQDVEIPRQPRSEELSSSDIARLRLLLDRALQPVDMFDGFDSIDQFQTSALRYQLNFAGYALSLYQHVHVPAFRAYLCDAQRNLILKHRDSRVWGYWPLENAWGSFDRNADPMGRDNVMFTGFVATQIAAFESASGDRRFSQAGSLVFERRGRECFRHDLPDMVHTLCRNIETSRFGLIACEPNWIFPLCNSIAFAAIQYHDALRWEELAPQLSAAIDSDFLSADGQLIACRSSYVGFGIPLVGGAAVQSLPCFFLNATLPALARRQWLTERQRIYDGGRLRRSRFWPVDTGNYGFSRVSSYAATAAAAAEMGDQAMASELFALLDSEYPAANLKGASHRPGVSLWSHAAEVMARVSREGSFRKMMTGQRPVSSHPSPFVTSASYPAILPARAVAHEGRLECVVYPGDTRGLHEIGLAGLVPQREYHWHGGVFTADGQGTASLTLPVVGRTEFSVTPAT